MGQDSHCFMVETWAKIPVHYVLSSAGSFRCHADNLPHCHLHHDDTNLGMIYLAESRLFVAFTCTSAFSGRARQASCRGVLLWNQRRLVPGRCGMRLPFMPFNVAASGSEPLKGSARRSPPTRHYAHFVFRSVRDVQHSLV